MRLVALVVSATLFCGGFSPADAALKTVGKNETLNIDPAMVPPFYKAAFATMQLRCIKCHTMERTVIAIKYGVAPISNGVFNRTATKAYGVKMMRKKDSNMNKQEVTVVIDLLNYLVDEAEQK